MPGVTLLVAYLQGFVNFFGCEADIRRASCFFHFLKAAGIAAVYADDAGAIGTVDVVEIDAPSGWVLLGCTAGKQIRIAAKAAARPMGRIRPRGRGAGGAAFGRRRCGVD